MKGAFATSLCLYFGDACFVGLLIYGLAGALIHAANFAHRSISIEITARQLRNFMAFQILWLATGLVLFKFIILQGGPGFTKLVATGNHGSVQFSTLGECVAALLTIYGLTRWIFWTIAHVKRLKHDTAH